MCLPSNLLALFGTHAVLKWCLGVKEFSVTGGWDLQWLTNTNNSCVVLLKKRRLRTATAAAVSTAGKEALGGGDRLAAKPMMMAEHSSGDYGLRRRLRLRLRWLLRRSRPVAAAWS
nr:hypothetical protein Iba_chr07fCG5350 [Ipomoea batatas]GMD38248.1 hypothetical protein Iba_chr09fCG2110 [Ipomoea batatas]